MTRPNDGFTLLETLVAVAILAFALVALVRTVSDGIGGVRRTEEYARAVQLAQSQLDMAGATQPLRDGTTAGGDDGGYHWVVRVSPYAAPRDRGTPVSFHAFWVTATVEWASRTGTPSVSLTTLKLAQQR